MGAAYDDETRLLIKTRNISAIIQLRLKMRTMMKTLWVVISLSILAIGIAASANIQTSEDKKIHHTANTDVQGTNIAHSSSSKRTADPTTISFLLGIGIVSLVSFSRRD